MKPRENRVSILSLHQPIVNNTKEKQGIYYHALYQPIVINKRENMAYILSPYQPKVNKQKENKVSIYSVPLLAHSE